MLLGPIRHSYTAKERAEAQGIGHLYLDLVMEEDLNTKYKTVKKNVK